MIFGSKAIKGALTRGQIRCMILTFSYDRRYIPVCLRTLMREIGEQAVCDGLRGTRWIVRDLGEAFPTRRGSRPPMEVLPKEVVLVVCRQSYAQAFGM